MNGQYVILKTSEEGPIGSKPIKIYRVFGPVGYDSGVAIMDSLEPGPFELRLIPLRSVGEL